MSSGAIAKAAGGLLLATASPVSAATPSTTTSSPRGYAQQCPPDFSPTSSALAVGGPGEGGGVGGGGSFSPPPPSVIRSTNNMDQSSQSNVIMTRRSVSHSGPVGGGGPSDMASMMDMLFPVENEIGGCVNGASSAPIPPRHLKSTLNPLASLHSPSSSSMMDYDAASGGGTPNMMSGHHHQERSAMMDPSVAHLHHHQQQQQQQHQQQHHHQIKQQQRLLVQFPHGGGATWSQASIGDGSSYKASSLLDSHDRFKPERNNQRRPVARMRWGGGGGNPSPGGGGGGGRWSQCNMAGDLISCSTGISPGSITPASSAGGVDMLMPGYFGQFNQARHGAPGQFQRLPLESESRVSSMTIADISPRIAVKKVLLLYEHAQYHEAANFIDRLSVTTFRIILRELPIDIFIDAMPHSLPILESLYSKVFASEGTGGSLKSLKPYAVLMHIVSFFSRDDTNQQCRSGRPSEQFLLFLADCKKILRVMVLGEACLIKTLQQRAKALDKAVEGMGHHSLVGTTDESLLPLHDALKLEFRRVVDTYKEALQKLEESALTAKNMPKSLARGPAPVAASHQRQLSLRVDEIQDRLIKNKSLLNVVEPTLDNHCLDVLLGILERRIDLDKDTLFQFTQLRKEAGDGSSGDAIVAPLLMRYSRASKKVLEIMREAATEAGTCLDDFEDDSSDLSGYHSDSDSAIMTSGNSPYVTPRARYNFLSRSVRSKQHLRPSLLGSCVSSGHSQSGRSLSTGSAQESSTGSALSSLDSGSCSLVMAATSGSGASDIQQYKTLHHALRAVGGSGGAGNTPTRPRHVKHKNQLQKHSSVVSTSSITSDSCSSRCSAGSSSPENTRYQGIRTAGGDIKEDCGDDDKGADTISLLSGCVECVTLVSVPDNQVITQGINHRCANPSHAKTNDVVNQLRAEVSQLRNNLRLANATIAQLNHGSLKSEITNRATGGSSGNKMAVVIANRPAAVGSQEERKQFLVREYGALYAQGRVETMDALDALPDLVEADELKGKLLFSVIVLAFRAVQTSLAEIKEQVSTLLQLEQGCDSQPYKDSPSADQPTNPLGELQRSQQRLVQSLSEYLHHSQQKVDHSRCVEVVANQLWTTLYDYPCLKTCQPLLKYIRTSVNLAWGLSNLNPPCMLEYETKMFSRDKHVRFHSSDNTSETIKTYLWPALMEGGSGGQCVHKGVVIT